MTQEATIEFKPVLGDDGQPILFDLFINGKWMGSRRTMHNWRIHRPDLFSHEGAWPNRASCAIIPE